MNARFNTEEQRRLQALMLGTKGDFSVERERQLRWLLARRFPSAQTADWNTLIKLGFFALGLYALWSAAHRS